MRTKRNLGSNLPHPVFLYFIEESHFPLCSNFRTIASKFLSAYIMSWPSLGRTFWPSLRVMPDSGLLSNVKNYPENSCEPGTWNDVRLFSAKPNLSEATIKACRTKYSNSSTRSQYSTRLIVRFVNILWETSCVVPELYPRCNEHLANLCIECLSKEVRPENLLSIKFLLWLEISPAYVTLFLRSVVLEVVVSWKQSVAFEGLGPPHSSKMMVMLREQYEKISFIMEKLRRGLRWY